MPPGWFVHAPDRAAVMLAKQLKPQLIVAAGDTTLFPFGMGTGGSRSATMSGSAFHNAAEKVIEIHGTAHEAKCLDCGQVAVAALVDPGDATHGRGGGRRGQQAGEAVLVGSMDIPSIKNLKIGMQQLDLQATGGLLVQERIVGHDLHLEAAGARRHPLAEQVAHLGLADAGRRRSQLPAEVAQIGAEIFTSILPVELRAR